MLISGIFRRVSGTTVSSPYAVLVRSYSVTGGPASPLSLSMPQLLRHSNRHSNALECPRSLVAEARVRKGKISVSGRRQVESVLSSNKS